MKNLYYVAYCPGTIPKLATFRLEKQSPSRYWVEVDSIEFILSRFYISRMIDKGDMGYFITGSKAEALNWLKKRLQAKLEQLEEEMDEVKDGIGVLERMGSDE